MSRPADPFPVPAPGAAPYRTIPLGSRAIHWERRDDGSWRLRSAEPLGPYPGKLTDHLRDAAQRHPRRTFLAVRDPGSSASPAPWIALDYASAWDAVQRIAQGLLDLGLSNERPVAILSGSSIEHALLGLAALHAGIPYSPVTPAYALLSQDHAKLRHVLNLLRPGLVFADDGDAFDTAVARTAPPDAVRVHARTAFRHGASLPFAALQQHPLSAAGRAVCDTVSPDAPAKVLFTSGSTGLPKGVINTQRMIASNQQMFVQSIPAVAQDPLVIVSWLPWHHTSGSNQMLGLTLRCAGTLYVDDGKPVPEAVGRTVDNLREIAPTVYFSVPRGFAMLVPHLQADRTLRERFFSRLQLMYYSGSALGRTLVQELDALAVASCGHRIAMMSGYGATETAPAAVAANWLTDRTGLAGLPVPGVELKLTPVGNGKFEARLRGPNVTPGYWGQPELSATLFDDEGFARMGDALSFVVPDDPAAGLAFDGRIAEDFKLSTGTWVSVGTLRARLIQEADGLFLDAVICGEACDSVGAFAVIDPAACARLCALPPETPLAQLLDHPQLRARAQSVLNALAAQGTGSSTHVARALLLREAPSAAAGELTDKGSINQRAFLANRPALLARLFTEPAPPDVLIAQS